MKKLLFIFTLLFLLISCSNNQDQRENLVDIRQIQSDGSNDYRIIFEDQIKKEKDEREKYKFNHFR